jgi:hypothetical protein
MGKLSNRGGCADNIRKKTKGSSRELSCYGKVFSKDADKEKKYIQ